MHLIKVHILIVKHKYKRPIRILTVHRYNAWINIKNSSKISKNNHVGYLNFSIGLLQFIYVIQILNPRFRAY